MPLTECPCGSGEYPEDLYDARGIYCCSVCTKCKSKRRREFWAEIFTNPQYECDEPIEPEEY